ncbi:MAG: chemotaxis protein CheA [Methanocella sp. PtaU1.Bin125]|nr:MAG: chemotaxis protein CheA [Methanocella sp. PtaU1.Bin125]
MDMSAYRDMFVSEAREHLQSFNQSLLALEKSPSDMDVIQEIFRSAHTLKGMSASMGFSDMEKLCHRMENLLDRIRNGNLAIDGAVANLLFQALDTLEMMIDRIQSGVDEPMDVSELVAEIERINDSAGPAPVTGKAPAAAPAPAEPVSPESQPAEAPQAAPACDTPAGANEFEVKVTLQKTCEFRSIRAFLVIQNLSEIGKVVSTVPDMKDIENEKIDFDLAIVLGTDKDAREVERKALSVAEIATVLVTPRARPASAGAPDTAVHPGNGQARPEKPAAGRPGKDNKAIHSVRIDIDRLDTIMNLVGELVISRGRLFEISHRRGILEMNDTMTMLDRSITDLQNEVMRIRMLPVDNVFNRFPRIVRDLAKKEGKEIELIIEGQDTELDRTVLDEISDPLNHMIRNAVDHGIEAPDVRVAAGKPACGTIRLIARRERSNVIIEIIDDGKGIDVGRVKRKAVDRGIITQAQADSMSQDEAVLLIFKSGLSTADKVTEVSGRGVGMDIVRTKVENLGGLVRIETQPGKGTRTMLKLPPTIAIVQALLVNVGGEKYAISITNVVETEYINNADIKTIGGREAIVIRESILPLYRLHDLFAVPADGGNGKYTAVIVEKAEQKVALLVDSIESQHEIFVKPLTGLLQNVRGLEGVTIMGNGRVVPILDVASLTEVKS